MEAKLELLWEVLRRKLQGEEERERKRGVQERRVWEGSGLKSVTGKFGVFCERGRVEACECVDVLVTLEGD